MKKSQKLLLLFTIVLTVGCASKQQHYLQELQKTDADVSKFDISTGTSGDVAYLDINGLKNEAKPIVSFRILMAVAAQYADTQFEFFELRFRGETRLKFTKSDIIEVAKAFPGHSKPIAVFNELVARAKRPGRTVASAFPQNSGGGLFGALINTSNNMQAFFNTWFLEDIKSEMKADAKKSEVSLGNDL